MCRNTASSKIHSVKDADSLCELFLSPNDVHRLENMDLIPAEEGGDDYYLNGGYVKLKNAGVAQQNKAAAVQQNQPKQTQPEEQDLEEEPDSDNRLSESKPRKNGRRNR